LTASRGLPEPWPFRPWVGVERGGHLESVHDGLLVVVDDRGEVRASWGDPSWRSFLRSSAKMMQALPLVESGAADRFGLEARHLALCCASHSGEPVHVGGVREILSRAGLDEGLLHCGPHAPVHGDSARELVRLGERPRSIHNNCSGKHAGMLAACAHRGWDVAGYWKPDHPLQREILAALGELADVDPDTIEHGVDGCGVPAFRMPAVRFAHALARFAATNGAARRHAGAAARLFAAMTAHPELVGGSGRFCTELPRAARRPLLAKAGAEGFYAVAWREEPGRGVALAAKAAAGDSRSRDFAVTEALRQLGILDADGVERLAPFHSGPLRNHAGEAVGRLTSLMDLSGAAREP
jgi:L-asparaginase II